MTGWVGRAGLGLVAGLSLGGSILASGSTGWGDSVCGAVPVGSALPDGGRLAPGQVANASIIISVAARRASVSEEPSTPSPPPRTWSGQGTRRPTTGGSSRRRRW